MKRASLLTVLLLAGCDAYAPWWQFRYTPTTDAERKAVAEHVEKVCSPPPASVSGDPDWYEAIQTANTEARETFCRPTLWERVHIAGGNWDYSGRWRYASKDEIEAETAKNPQTPPERQSR